MIFILIDFIKNILKYIVRNSFREQMYLKSKLFFKKRYQLVENLKFDNYKIDIIDAKSFLAQYDEIFVNHSYQFKTKSQNPIIIDCGSNIGLSVLYYKKAYPNAIVHSFEPDQKVFMTLFNNINKNNLQKVYLNNCAVWVKNGTIDFFHENSDGGHLVNDDISEGNISKVECISLSDYISKFDLIDFLKIDIEGAEYEIMMDSSMYINKVKYLFLEFHSKGNDEWKLIEILEILSKNRFSFKIETSHQSIDPFGKINIKPFNFQLNIFAINNNF